MSRLPVPGQDDDVWGEILNDFLEVSHNTNGTLQASALTQAGGVTSINGKTTTDGAISLSAADLGAPTTLAGDSDVAISSPANNQILAYENGAWVNQAQSSGPPSGSAGGDLSGSYPDPSVAKVNGVSVSGTPTAGESIVATSGTAAGWSSVSGTTDWINVKTQYGAAGNGVADDTPAIQNALSAANDGQVVYLPAGIYKTSAPLTIPPYVVLRGDRGAVAAADVNNSGANYGSVIRPAAGWASSLPVAGILTLLDCQAGGYTSPPSPNNGVNPGVHIRDVFLDGTTSPSSVDGIAAYGSVQAVRIDSVGMNKITGNGITGKANPSSTASDKSPDGWHVNNVIVQDATGNGWGGVSGVGDGISNDTIITDMHVQGCGGDGFGIISGNCTLIGCRADYSGGNGYTINAFNAAGGSGGLASSIKLVGCNTDSSTQNGVNVVNTSATGTSARTIVQIIGGNLHADGVNGGSGGGGYAGVAVSGRNIVFASGVVVAVDTENVTAGCPEYGLATASAGTGPGVPISVRFSSGLLNGATAPINNAAPATDLSIAADVTTLTGIFSSSLTTSPFLANLNAASLDTASIDISGTTNSRGGLLQITQNQSAPTNPGVNLTGQTATDGAVASLVSGDAFSRYRINADGTQNWGAGSTTLDTQLTRNGTSQLLLNDSGSGNSPQLKIQATTSLSTQPLLQIANNTAGDLAQNILVNGDTSSRWKIDSNGKQQWGPGNATQDTDLYRSAADTLTTDGTLVAGTALQAPQLSSSGLTGAKAASRYVGATSSGAPISGTFNTGDFVVDQSGKIWVCTAAGTPGTWLTGSVGAPLSLSAAEASGGVLSVSNTTSAPSNPSTGLIASAAGDLTLGIEVTGDADYRFTADSNGKLQWGPGNAAADVDLYRSASGVLTTDDSFDVVTRALGSPQPRDLGIIAWTADPANVGTNAITANGTIYLCAIYVARSTTATKILWDNQTAAQTATAGQNFVGLYNSSGTLLQSTEVDSSVTVAGFKSTAITSQAVTPGMYWLAMLFNCSGSPVAPSIRCGQSTTTGIANMNLGVAVARYATAGTTQTALANITPANNVLSAPTWWMALA